VKAGTAYISSLGTTGLLIASSILLLLIGGTIVAFDGWPDGDASAEPAFVSIRESPRAVREGSVTTRRQLARATRAERRRSAAIARRHGRARARTDRGLANASGPSIVTDPVISDLPAPDAAGAAGGSPAGGGPAGGGTTGGGSGGGGEATRHLGEVLSGVSPQVGSAIGDVGQAVDQAIGTSVPPLVP
jgi:hypothetical protein